MTLHQLFCDSELFNICDKEWGEGGVKILQYVYDQRPTSN